MEPEFWHSRWRQGQIGFHRSSVHEQLRRYGDHLRVRSRHPRVLVPLCGKTLDMVYLHNEGSDVVGVELSSLAAQAFFAEHGLKPKVASQGIFEIHSNQGIDILCGNFFSTTAKDIGPVDAAYDRAALVALPPALRARYVDHLAELLPAGAPVLLISFDYPQDAMTGPPFSVPPNEINALFGPKFEVTALDNRDVLHENERFKAHLSNLHEQTYLMHRRNTR